ncbi:hypothetical protein [Halovenus halobia]|uniref:hypothetical protein n=1 Tax=Halovenus halobia TaxID=3396622 RepID=UPI003F5653D3
MTRAGLLCRTHSESDPNDREEYDYRSVEQQQQPIFAWGKKSTSSSVAEQADMFGSIPE